MATSYGSTWNPDIYLRFAAYRARPAEDLMARLNLTAPGDIYDLGCGPGTLTLQLKQRWPERRVIAVDSSREMLTAARERDAKNVIEWREGDIATWRADAPAAMIFANAALHWLDDHATLVPHLMRQLAPGGTFAVQMPQTRESKYTPSIYNVMRSPRWKARLGDLPLHPDPHPAAFYYDLVAPLAAEAEVWETNYNHVLPGEHPVRDWMLGTGLVPVLSVLNEAEQQEFLADYDAETERAYARQIDGTVLFDMRRLFILARRAG